MNRTAQQTRARRILMGLAASAGGFAVAFPAARALGPGLVFMTLAAAIALVGLTFLIRRAVRSGVSTSAGDVSCVAENLASL